MKNKPFIRQIAPLILAFVVFLALTLIYYGEIKFLNLFTKSQILTKINPADVIIGLTIYLKTSIDFAIFMGNLMKSNGGIKNRIAIEIGTAVGNAAGTFAILAIWNFFREITWLLAVMIILAAFVLIRLAKDGIEHAKEEGTDNTPFQKLVNKTEQIILFLNKLVEPILSRIMPNVCMKTQRNLTWKKLFIFSFTIPFILGLDDFAGYVPLFNIVNVFGFGIGVMLGHMILNILLFISPSKTIAAVKNPVISYLGSIAFILLAIWGIYEAFKILIEAYIH